MSESNTDDGRVVGTFGPSGFSPTRETVKMETGAGNTTTEYDFSKEETTQQADVDEHAGAIEWYDPLYDPEELLLLLQRSEPHSSCVQAKSKAVAGHGFEIVPHKSADIGSDNDGPPEEIVNFWYGIESTFQLGPSALNATPTEVLEHAWDDLESIGYFSIEILTNPSDYRPTGLAHVPAQNIRKLKDKFGYVQLENGIPKTYFGEAGGKYGNDQTFIDAQTGEVSDTATQLNDVANELITLRNYAAASPHYGLPDIIPAIETLAGDLAAREFNERFFANDTVPRIAVIVSGGELTERAWKELKETFNKLSKEKNAHRGILLESASSVATDIGEKAGVDIQIEPLTVGVDEDAGFTQYRENNEHYILQAHSVPPVIAGRTEGVNFASAKSQRVNFAQNTVKPKQERFAARLYKIIHVMAFGVTDWTVEFNLRGGENELREAETIQMRSKAANGALTINELRHELGFESLDGSAGEQLVATLKKSGGGSGGGGGGGQPTEPSVDKSIQPYSGMSKRELLKAASSFTAGDVVKFGDGEFGVILEVKTSPFEAPTKEGEEIQASSDNPVFIVAKQSGGFGYFAADELEPAEIPSDEKGDVEEIEAIRSGKWNPFSTTKAQFELPDGWTRLTLLDAWASMGASFSGCMDTLNDAEMCASMKDTVYGTTYWR